MNSPYFPPLETQAFYEDQSQTDLLLWDKIVLLLGGSVFGFLLGVSAAVLIAATIQNVSLLTITGCGFGMLLLTLFNVVLYRRSLGLRKAYRDAPAINRGDTPTVCAENVADPPSGDDSYVGSAFPSEADARRYSLASQSNASGGRQCK